MVKVSSWGGLKSTPHQLKALYDCSRVADVLADGGPGIAYGMGRSYGDICLNSNGILWSTVGLDRFISFDVETGVLECEAGVLLKDIQRIGLRHGWMLAVTPGTQYVTVGGAIANDVHGKNHHRRGTFGDHIERLLLVRSSGEEIECGPELRPDWFAATVGGMGLTGVISRVALRLMAVAGPLLDVEVMPYDSLEEFFEFSAESEQDWEYTVSWIDCVSRRGRRGIFMRGNHAPVSRVEENTSGQLTVPFTPPVSLVNRFSLRPLNAAYYRMNKMNAGPSLQHYQPFFYPLDKILHWNRMYGPNGFYQYQCVIPSEHGMAAVERLLAETSASNAGSFLAVLKVFGDSPAPGMMSFPRAGVTLALDFPNRGASTTALMQRLDTVVARYGGRLYAAKDARMPRGLFEAGYPDIDAFLPFCDDRISSELSRRLLGR